MRVVVAGGHGQIALILERLLSARGDAVAGLIRNPAQAPDLRDAGAEPIVVDLEHTTVEEVAGHLVGADAVVFAAGAGPGSGAARKETVDRAAAVLLADAAEAAGVGRYLMISARGADSRADDDSLDPVFRAYLRAKAAADEDVRARSRLNVTIVRPGGLTDEPGTGRVTIADHTGPGSIPRADVAAVLVALLDSPGTRGQTFELVAGDTPIAEAVAARTAAADHTSATVAAVERFNDAVNRHDPDGVAAAVTDDCRFESTQPPDGDVYEGREQIRAYFARLFDTAAERRFDTEELFTAGDDRVVVTWHHHWVDHEDRAGHVRGVDLFRVRDGRVAEKRSYVKG